MTNDIVRVGILGQGRSGRDIHAEYLKDDPRFRIVAVADVLADRRERAEEEYGCASHADYRDLLARDDLDLVVNALPSYLHAPVSTEILNGGHNVLCEKPLARRAAEVDEMIAAARRSGKTLAIFQQSRFAPYFQEVRRVIDTGVLGRIVAIKIRFNGYARRWDWQTLQEMAGGSLLNTGPHPMDQALQLLDYDGMPNVWCHMECVNVYGDAEDYVKCIITAPERPLIDLEISSCDAYPQYTYQLQGSQGGLAGTTKHLDWRFFDPAEAPEQTLIREPLPGPSYCRETLPWQEGSWDLPAEQEDLFHTMSGKIYSNLYEALTAGAPLVVTPQQVRQQIAVIEECHRQNPLPRLGE
ncbi:MAG: Gfo/Idh/MocA family oxidoreductase [Chloroflexi bacterium]|nr:Gfo/Idh/MocA family oxidoreductase [Chloroflexota bacterium]